MKFMQLRGAAVQEILGGAPPLGPDHRSGRGNGFQSVLPLQRAKAWRQHSAARSELSGKTALFPRNDRPYGLKRKRFKLKMLYTRNASFRVLRKEGVLCSVVRAFLLWKR